VNSITTSSNLQTTSSNLQTTSSNLQTTSSNLPTTSQLDYSFPTTPPLPASTTQTAYEFKPESRNNSDEQYEFNTYKYTALNNLTQFGHPTPVYNSGVANTALEGADNLGCDINDGNCSYNTNLNI
jgi:hypothetical protein